MFCQQYFAAILAAEADDHDVEAELVDLSQCEPEDDLIVTVVDWFLVIYLTCHFNQGSLKHGFQDVFYLLNSLL